MAAFIASCAPNEKLLLRAAKDIYWMTCDDREVILALIEYMSEFTPNPRLRKAHALHFFNTYKAEIRATRARA